MNEEITWENSFAEFWSFDPETDDVNWAELIDKDIAQQIYQHAFKQGGKKPWWSINKQQLQILLRK